MVGGTRTPVWPRVLQELELVLGGKDWARFLEGDRQGSLVVGKSWEPDDSEDGEGNSEWDQQHFLTTITFDSQKEVGVSKVAGAGWRRWWLPQSGTGGYLMGGGRGGKEGQGWRKKTICCTPPPTCPVKESENVPLHAQPRSLKMLRGEPAISRKGHAFLNCIRDFI